MATRVFDRMEERLRIAQEESDAEAFMHLVYYGELLLKLTVAGLVACLEDDADRTGYSIAYKLVRADSIGTWNEQLNEILTGPARQRLPDSARDFANELTRKHSDVAWVADFSGNMRRALETASIPKDSTGAGARAGWDDFCTLRNRARAHGALGTAVRGELAPILLPAMRSYARHYSLFHQPWAYLKKNLSGKYRVTSLSHTDIPEELAQLKSSTTGNLEDGVYVHAGTPKRVELAATDADFQDFLVPEGRLRAQGYELVSYITGRKAFGDASKYADPPGARPASETASGLALEGMPAGHALSNLPPTPRDYVPRHGLEQKLVQELLSPYPVITLVGPGGIGKTSLALKALHSPTIATEFDVVLWFSARDIDLEDEGPRLVEPQVLNIFDAASQYADLMSPLTGVVDKDERMSFLQSSLERSPTDGPMLFVMDNFETVSNPEEMFRWLANCVRPPNKILITSRTRDFDRGLRIRVPGMTADESETLIRSLARKRGFEGMLSGSFIQQLHDAAQGHPYIMRVLLGEAQKRDDFKSVRPDLKRKDDLLRALFDRTFSSLSALARRVFLTLCSWSSRQNDLCFESVVSLSTGQPGVSQAIEELELVSFVNRIGDADDGTSFLDVPIAGFQFGQRKLSTSSDKLAIEADRELLMMFGPARASDLTAGAVGRAREFLRVLSLKSDSGEMRLRDGVEVLTHIASNSPGVWKLLSRAFEESQRERDITEAIRFTKSYLESGPPQAEQREAWLRVAGLSQLAGDVLGEMHAIAEYVAIDENTREHVSDGIHRVAQLLADHKDSLDRPERSVLVRRLIEAFQPHVEEASATELSRLAWLHLHLRQEGLAKRVVRRGLQKDSENYHCRKLAERLGVH